MKAREKKPLIPRQQDAVEIKKNRTIQAYFILIVFLTLLFAGIIIAAVFVLFSSLNFFDLTNGILIPIAVAIACIVVGTGLAAIASKHFMRRISLVRKGMSEVAKGNFKVRVEEKDKRDLTEFGELERSFNKMTSDLDGIEMFRNDFINNFSHEFKTPIVSIRGFARQLRSGNLTDEQRAEYLDIIISQSERLAYMSSNVLLLTKLENQAIVSEKSLFDLDEQIRNSILLLEKEWSEKNIDLDIELDEVDYHFNEEMMSHIWINLLSNAIKFTGESGRISCRLKKTESEIIFSVEDDGIGMTDEVKSRIFEKFYQGDDSHTARGNGIGLNIVSRIVTLASGRIEVESQPKKGSKFTVRLPAQ